MELNGVIKNKKMDKNGKPGEAKGFLILFSVNLIEHNCIKKAHNVSFLA